MKKDKKIENIAKKVQLCHKKNFKLSASFLFGTPGETLEDMEKTIRFATSLPLDSATFGIVIPFPGTELRKEAIERGYLVKREYKYYNPTSSNFRSLIETPDWSAEDLNHMIKKANYKFFFRPLRVIKTLPRLFKHENRKRCIALLNRLISKSSKNCN